MSINFKKGQFLQFEATTTIHLGRLERNLSKGDVVDYDGTTLKMGGQEISMPELKAGIKRGWLKLSEPSSQLPTQIEKRKPVAKKEKPVAKNEKPQMKVERIYDEEKSVSTINEEKPVVEEEKTLEEKYPVQHSEADRDMIDLGGFKTSSVAQISTASSSDGISESQGAEALPLNLKTASQNKVVLSDSNKVSEEISKLDNLEMEVVEREEEEISSLREEAIDEQSKEMAQLLQAVDGEVTPDQGAVSIGEDKSDLILLPSGVEWDKSKHWSKRGQIALDLYGHDSDILNEIMAVESKGVVKAITKGLEG